NEVFDAGLVERNVGAVVARCGFEWQDFAALGRAREDDEAFGLTPFSLRTAAYANGVSALHGEVSRELWHDVWPDCAIENVPSSSSATPSGCGACSRMPSVRSRSCSRARPIPPTRAARS